MFAKKKLNKRSKPKHKRDAEKKKKRSEKRHCGVSIDKTNPEISFLTSNTNSLSCLYSFGTFKRTKSTSSTVFAAIRKISKSSQFFYASR